MRANIRDRSERALPHKFDPDIAVDAVASVAAGFSKPQLVANTISGFDNPPEAIRRSCFPLFFPENYIPVFDPFFKKCQVLARFADHRIKPEQHIHP